MALVLGPLVYVCTCVSCACACVRVHISDTDRGGGPALVLGPLCLRPDLTIASCLRYLENNLKGKEKIFYSGQAYRKSQNKKA